MSQSLSHSQLKELARHGAVARIQELETEIAAIRAAFPDATGRRHIRRRGRNAAAGRASASKGRQKKGWTAAQRQAVAERMRKYWAARKAGKKK